MVWSDPLQFSRAACGWKLMVKKRELEWKNHLELEYKNQFISWIACWNDEMFTTFLRYATFKENKNADSDKFINGNSTSATIGLTAKAALSRSHASVLHSTTGTGLRCRRRSAPTTWAGREMQHEGVKQTDWLPVISRKAQDRERGSRLVERDDMCCGVSADRNDVAKNAGIVHHDHETVLLKARTTGLHVGSQH